MVKGIYQASRSLDTRMKNMSIVANNLSNLNTTGFKRKVPFSEVLENEGKSKMKEIIDFRQGELVPTEGNFDLAIEGEKIFFAIQTEDGPRFTRNGRFTLSEEGFLVDENGDSVLGKSGEINIKSAMLNEDQTVHITEAGEVRVGEILVDSVMLVKFEEPQKLTNTSSSQFQIEGDAYEQAKENEYKVFQGYLEGANVNPIMEMESMINVNQDYTSAQKMIGFLDKSLGQANEVGKV
ncbi:MAG: flagellar basal-body rod protein FlgF [Melioribacteraceae bacterium]|nr:MAG: flagellar basal-body rod protein FlgF [Melioribacteraceae bacterium]